MAHYIKEPMAGRRGFGLHAEGAHGVCYFRVSLE